MSQREPVPDQSARARPTGKTLAVMRDLCSGPKTWADMRAVVGSNRGMASVYRRMRDHNWIAYSGTYGGPGAAYYELTRSGSAALDEKRRP